MNYSSSAMSGAFTTSTTTTTLTEGNGYKRKREEDVEEGSPAKKAKIESDNSVLNREAILAVLKNVTENLSSFASTHLQDHEFIHGQVTQLTQVQQSLTHVFQNAQPYQFDTVRICLGHALSKKNFSAIFQYLNEIIQHHDLDRFLKNYNLVLLTGFFQLSLAAAFHQHSKELFSALIQEMHRRQPSFLTNPLFITGMKKVFSKEECSDLKLTIHSKQKDAQAMTLRLNKAYLGTVSPYFYQMFFGTQVWKEAEQSELNLVIEDLQSLFSDIPLTQENIYDVLRYCHTRTIYFRGAKECLAILLLAEKWQIKPLVDICDQYLRNSIDLLTDSFEAVWDIAEGTQCTQLKSALLEWAASQNLQKKQVKSKVSKILETKKDEVKVLNLSFPLSKNLLKTMTTQFPKVDCITFKGLDAKQLAQQVPILTELKTLTHLTLENMNLTPKIVTTITSTQLQALRCLYLINCDFKWGKIDFSNTNAAQLCELKLIKRCTKRDVEFLKHCTNLESLHLSLDAFNKAHFLQLRKLDKLRALHVVNHGMLGKGWDYAASNEYWTHLEQLELNNNSFILNFDHSMPMQHMVYSAPALKIFKSNIKGATSLLSSISSLVTQLSITTSMDQEKNISFHPKPSLNTLKWDCCSDIPVLAFLASLINIQNLHLKNAELEDAILTQLQQFSHLHTLHFEQITNLDDDCLARIAQLPWLESLTLTQCDLITDRGLRSLLNSENLQKVIIQDCMSISEQGATLVKEDQKIREFAFIPFQEKDWTARRAWNILEIQRTHNQSLDYLVAHYTDLNWASLFPITFTSNAEIKEKVKEKIKQATEIEPMQYTHWKRLALLYLKTGEFEQSRRAYQQAATLGMDASDLREAIQQIEAAQNQEMQVDVDINL